MAERRRLPQGYVPPRTPEERELRRRDAERRLEARPRAPAIRKALARLEAKCHPVEFVDEIRRLAVHHSALLPAMKALVEALRRAWPAEFAEATSPSTLPKRQREHALQLALFMRSRQKQGPWCVEHDVERKELQRWLTRYRDNATFRAQVDDLLALLRATLGQ